MSRPLRTLALSVDVGSTTIKVVVVDAASRSILWSRYQRHETRHADTTLELLRAAEAAVPEFIDARTVTAITGSGAKRFVEPLGARFVQEVNAVTLAVEALHPDAGSVVELGGQDAKIIVFVSDPATGQKRAVCSMNDKCASGTGATIDKCLVKIGLTSEAAARVAFDARQLHKVAAKCGVFAETDIVNLVKSGIAPEEIVCSLADAIVRQNLSVLARGNTLRPQVVLLGGPNAYLPVLRDCWRLRIQETWTERGIKVRPDASPEDLVFAPQHAQYYAGYGAALYVLDDSAAGRCYPGAAAVARQLGKSGEASLGAGRGPPLGASREEVADFLREYSIAEFQPAVLAHGDTIAAVIGLDGGSTSSKAVLLSPSGEVLFKAYQLSRGNPLEDMQQLLVDLADQVHAQGATLKITGVGATGYAADVVDETIHCDVNLVETVAHMQSAVHFFHDVDVICDIGGQDIKVLFIANGDIRDFRLSNQCSAGNGMLLQTLADQCGVPVEQYADFAFRAERSPEFSYGCAVFLDSDRVTFQKEGYSKEELLAGMARVLPKNVWQYVVQIPRLAELGTRFVLQGGTQRNMAAVKAQVDYIRSRVPGAIIRVHPHSGEAGAIGAALEAARVVQRHGRSRFIGLEAAIGLEYTTRNDESTRCRFCPNLCARTFVDGHAPDGSTSRYISGFSCERGTVESKEVMQKLVERRKELKKLHVNLLEYEAGAAFRRFYEPQSLPAATTERWTRSLGRRLSIGAERRSRMEFRRSSAASAERRSTLRIGIPRVLNLYSTAPLFRAYFETLGVRPENICFSPPTSEELFSAGAKYGAVDPCYPAKVAQAHLHHLLFRTHSEHRPLHYIFFPTLTHVPTFVEHVMDSTTCPIVAGTPNVMKAAFTKDENYFAARDIEYVDSAFNLVEPRYFQRQMFEAWGRRLDVTEEESDFAVAQGWQALRQFTDDLEMRGLQILEQAEAEHRVALLVLGRPYHADPGLNHGVLEQFQAYGYPVLTIRSIPQDVGWLQRWFAADLRDGHIKSPLDIRDVWPENYSTNSVQKVWAAKFAARHPNIAVLDLSSFKCGHDAPTYGLIDSIIRGGRKPYMALHDLDANKPAGSLKIRVKTYGYTLARYEQQLQDRAVNLSELERSVAAKRRELLAERREALERRSMLDSRACKERREMATLYAGYLDDEPRVYGVSLNDLQRPFPSAGPWHHAVADVAPLPGVTTTVEHCDPGQGAFPILEVVGAGGCGSGCRSGGCCS